MITVALLMYLMVFYSWLVDVILFDIEFGVL